MQEMGPFYTPAYKSTCVKRAAQRGINLYQNQFTDNARKFEEVDFLTKMSGLHFEGDFYKKNTNCYQPQRSASAEKL